MPGGDPSPGAPRRDVLTCQNGGLAGTGVCLGWGRGGRGWSGGGGRERGGGEEAPWPWAGESLVRHAWQRPRVLPADRRLDKPEQATVSALGDKSAALRAGVREKSSARSTGGLVAPGVTCALISSHFPTLTLTET